MKFGANIKTKITNSQMIAFYALIIKISYRYVIFCALLSLIQSDIFLHNRVFEDII
jgi:hypothetical protein